MKIERTFIPSRWFAIRFVFDTDGFWIKGADGRRVNTPLAIMHSHKIESGESQRNITATALWFSVTILTMRNHSNPSEPV